MYVGALVRGYMVCSLYL